jgi:hypothetical protein
VACIEVGDSLGLSRRHNNSSLERCQDRTIFFF